MVVDLNYVVAIVNTRAVSSERVIAQMDAYLLRVVLGNFEEGSSSGRGLFIRNNSSVTSCHRARCHSPAQPWRR
jgi:hypothetical protein